MTTNKITTLNRVITKIPGNQECIIRDYLSQAHYAVGAVNEIISKVLDYNIEMRNSQVYGISIEGNNIICIDILFLED